MCAIKLLHNISPKCRLQLKPDKRSVSGRNQVAENLSSQFQKLLLDRKEGKLTIGEYRNALKKITGRNKKIICY